MIFLAGVIGFVVICIILAPFFVGRGGLLQGSSSINSPEQLVGIKTALVKRFVEEEAAFKAGSLSALAWQRRQSFLQNRYIDAARRLDFLTHGGKDLAEVGGVTAAGAKAHKESK